MSDGGKGSSPRPIPNRKQYEENWDSIFKKPKEQPKEKEQKCTGITE